MEMEDQYALRHCNEPIKIDTVQATYNGKEQPSRVVCHVDLDCFYCQVEHVRLKIPQEEPLAVQQWKGVIAVNYPARAFGIKRGELIDSIKIKCPHIHLVHVETHCINMQVPPNTKANTSDHHDRNQEKVTLERYRKASNQIFGMISSRYPTIERASIDEAYFDLTEEVKKELREVLTSPGLTSPRNQPPRLVPEVSDTQAPSLISGRNSKISTQLLSAFLQRYPELEDESLADEILKTPSDTSLKLGSIYHDFLPLMIGGLLVYRVRQDIFKELGYTLSAGVSHNKSLSKMASSCYKPNKQAVIPKVSIDHLMRKLSVKKLRGLGGKFGAALLSHFPHLKKAIELQEYTIKQFSDFFEPKTAAWLWNVCRGIDNEPVVPNLKAKSMLAFKSLYGEKHLKSLERWMKLLSEEIYQRILSDYEAFSRKPKTMTIHYTKTSSERHHFSARSRSCPIAMGGVGDIFSLQSFEDLTLNTLRKIKSEELLPCAKIALGVSDFYTVEKGLRSIKDFLKPISSRQIINTKQENSFEEDINKVSTEECNLDDVSRPDDVEKGNFDRWNEDCENRQILRDTEEEAAYALNERGINEEDSEGNIKKPGFIRCGRCNELVSTHALQVHLDHHLALDLYNETNQAENAQLASSSGCDTSRIGKSPSEMQSYNASHEHRTASSKNDVLHQRVRNLPNRSISKRLRSGKKLPKHAKPKASLASLESKTSAHSQPTLHKFFK